jgi:hypothetical protein
MLKADTGGFSSHGFVLGRLGLAMFVRLPGAVPSSFDDE